MPLFYTATLSLRGARRLMLLAAMLLALPSGHAQGWMSRLDGGTPVARVALPGTHDAATGDGFMGTDTTDAERLAQTQQEPIARQWASGIRAFDLRPDVMADDEGRATLHIFHGVFATRRTFESVISQICDSLAADPTEFAVIVMRHESVAGRDGTAWARLMGECLARHAARLAAFSPTMTVDDARGKLLLISRDTYDGPLYGAMATGWAHGDDLPEATLSGNGTSTPLLLQDFYDTSAPDGPARKKAAITALATRRAAPATWSINHTSGYAETTVYATADDMSTSRGYRRNAAATNRHLTRLLRHGRASVGIVMMDFAATDRADGTPVGGATLTKAIIESNFRPGAMKGIKR